MDVAEVKKLKVPELRKELEDRGLDSSGLKQALQDRLEAILTSEADSKAGLAANGIQPAPAATAAPAAVASGAISVPATNHTPIEFKPAAGGAGAELTELQKKQARAKRFGVELSEAEQKALRAERFSISKGGNASAPAKTTSGSLPKSASGTLPMQGVPKTASGGKAAIQSTGTPMDQAEKAAELEKRKARAKRFELPINSNDEEQAKKKARADRFSKSAAQPNTSASGTAKENGAVRSNGTAAKTAVSEEEASKRQARALRFATGLPASKEASSGTTAEQIKKMEDRKIRFGDGQVAEAAAPSAQA